jgi:hypothetical protein
MGDAKGSIAFYRAVQQSGKRPARDLNRLMRNYSNKPLFINGIWLEKAGVPEGPMRREILLRIREEILAGKITRRADAVRLAESMR